MTEEEKKMKVCNSLMSLGKQFGMAGVKSVRVSRHVEDVGGG